LSVLVGGIAGASSRLGGGLTAVGPRMVSDVTPTNLSRLPLSQFEGKFRRVIRDTTLDAAGAPLAGVTVKVFDATTDQKVDQVVSDAAGVYEASVYNDATYQCIAYKAGAPDVAGASVNTVRGV
jgi:hypothetical protein